jgi:hypothetical protein
VNVDGIDVVPLYYLPLFSPTLIVIVERLLPMTLLTRWWLTDVLR